MRRARVVRIEWEQLPGSADLEDTDIIEAFRAADTFQPEEKVTVTGDPSFEVKEGDK